MTNVQQPQSLSLSVALILGESAIVIGLQKHEMKERREAFELSWLSFAALAGKRVT